MQSDAGMVMAEYQGLRVGGVFTGPIATLRQIIGDVTALLKRDAKISDVGTSDWWGATSLAWMRWAGSEARPNGWIGTKSARTA